MEFACLFKAPKDIKKALLKQSSATKLVGIKQRNSGVKASAFSSLTEKLKLSLLRCMEFA